MAEDEKIEGGEPSFKVEDRRHFDQEGNIKPADSVTEESSAAEAISTEPLSTSAHSVKPDFGAVLFPYVHSALVYLGEMQDPATGKITENLEAARQMIDILELLEAKTKGNLSKEEAKYLENVLFDLRMQYMQKAKLVK